MRVVSDQLNAAGSLAAQTRIGGEARLGNTNEPKSTSKPAAPTSGTGSCWIAALGPFRVPGGGRFWRGGILRL